MMPLCPRILAPASRQVDARDRLPGDAVGWRRAARAFPGNGEGVAVPVPDMSPDSDAELGKRSLWYPMLASQFTADGAARISPGHGARLGADAEYPNRS